MKLNRELERLLVEIHEALETYLYPCCKKCNTRSVERRCKCDEALEKVSGK